MTATVTPILNDNLNDNLNDLIGFGRDIRDDIDKLEKELKALKSDKETNDSAILDIMEGQGIDRTGTDTANVSITERKTPTATDWEKIYAFMLKKGYLHMLQKRLSLKAIEEIIELEGEIDGIEINNKQFLNFRRK